MELLEDRRFYVYVYLDSRKPGKYVYGEYEFEYEPFYVGKAIGRNHLRHLTEANREYKKGNQFKLNKIRKIQKETGKNPIIIKYIEGLTEEEAFLKYETHMINIIGRSDLGKGPLTNLTDGGEGGSGHIYTDEQKKALREINLKMWRETDHRKYIEEIYNNTDYKKRMSCIAKEINNRLEVKAKRSLSSKKNWKNDEYKSNIIEKLKKNWRDPGFRENHMKNINHMPCSDETKIKIGKSNRGWRNGVCQSVIINNDYFCSVREHPKQ